MKINSRVSLVISDVDGTLVTTEKILTEPSRNAVSRLLKAGVGFSLISSRPPFGLTTLAEQLGVVLPLGAYNGSMLLMPDGAILEQRLLAEAAAKSAAEAFREFAIDFWVFTENQWLVESLQGDYVAHETHTISTAPTVVGRLEEHLGGALKIVGASHDFDRLAACTSAMIPVLGGSATAARSQPYYLDITPAGCDKGSAVVEMARRIKVPLNEVATIGDMDNDISMFRQSGFSIAMGNASSTVKSQASVETRSNDNDGFAYAIESFILPRSHS